MECTSRGKALLLALVATLGLTLALPQAGMAACGGTEEQPPFLASGIDPNLLIMFDNSASMMDMAYVGAQGTCYDGTSDSEVESYQSGTTYGGYFDSGSWYSYNLTAQRFEATTQAAATTTCNTITAAGFTISRYSQSDACVVVAEAATAYPDVIAFAATGNFLNWVTASKVDVEKKVLTGGKYDASAPATPYLVEESRGCLGKRYVKKAVVTKAGDPDHHYYLTLAVRPPKTSEKADANDDTTRIEFYQVTEDGFENEACQAALNEFASDNPNQGQIKQDIDECMGYEGGNPNTLPASSNAAFNHAIHNCWYMAKHETWPPGAGTVNSMENACKGVYDNGVDPATITVEDQAYVCYGVYDAALAAVQRTGYVGRCWVPGTPAVCTDWYTSGSKAGQCKTWSATVDAHWESDACVEAALQSYCGYLEVPPVIDPSDQLSISGELWNIPAVLIDSGVISQLDDPMRVLKGRILTSTVPTGLIQEFASDIRMGAMVLNDTGCTAGDGNTRYTCAATSKDGGRIISAIDQSEAHTAALVTSLNSVKATTWTPLGEAMYEAIGYYTQRTSLRLNADDFTVDPDPVLAYCQDNNILLISEGASTMDLNASVKNFYTNDLGGADGDTDNLTGCDSLSGSTLFDDFVWYARHGTGTTIFNSEPWLPDHKENISTYVVSTGTNRTGLSGECNPTTMLEEAAENGHTTLYHGENPQTLEASLRSAFQTIRTAAAAGSAASVISASRGGEGALYQAIFWPNRIGPSGETIKWLGEVHALFVDKYGNLYEDTNSNRSLDAADTRVSFFYDSNAGRSMACSAALDASGGCPSGFAKELDEVRYLWSAADWLSSISAANIDSNRSVDASGRFQFSPVLPKRYIFTWEDLNNDGIVDTNEVLDFVPRDWLDAGLAVSGGRGSIPFDFGVNTSAEIDSIVKWVRGRDQTGMRSRQMMADFDHTGTPSQITWRLGDVVHSTPIVVAKPVESYHYLYRDVSYATFAEQYAQRRNVVYFGGNDGMLHAVNGGFYDVESRRFCRTVDCSDEGAAPTTAPELGTELWAYVPYNLLTHLKCLSSDGYEHKYYVDQRPRIFDVQIFSNDDDHPEGWGTILVGAMRFGGTPVAANTIDVNGTAGADYPADPRKFSSALFILDITNPEKPPKLLAEYTQRTTAGDVDLGYTTNIPTMVPMKGTTDTKWHLVFGTGPTALNGVSTQDARLLVYPLEFLVGTGRQAFRVPDAPPTTTTTGTTTVTSPGSFSLDSNSFISDLITVDFEVDTDYKADAVYFGTVSGNFGGWGGKLYRLVTRKLLDGVQVSTLPSEWSTLSTAAGTNPALLLDVGRPVTGSPAAGWDGKNYWVYFGSGRFFHPQDKTDSSSNAQETFYGVKESMTWAENTTTEACDGTFTWETVEKAPGSSAGSLELLRVDQIQVDQAAKMSASALSCSSGSCLPTGVTTFDRLVDYIAGTGSGCSAGSTTGTGGWYKEFQDDRERNVGQATLLGGLLTFTSYQPDSNICRSEGQSNIYGVYYQTGTPWYVPVFGDSAVTADTPAHVLDRLSLGVGMATTPSLHVGSQEGSTAFVQTSTGTIIEIPQPVMPKEVHTGRTYWEDLMR